MAGGHFAPRKDPVLLWFAGLLVGGLLAFLLIIGVFTHQRVALYVSVVVLLGSLWTLSRLAIHDTYDRVVEITLPLLLVALYLLWRTRHLKMLSPERSAA
jgi:hypothetical protein